ncbi:hypothetical protein [Leucobacter musarum]|uniref:hypothetical protein n=1 Tax=Leucobacter musarum TaxID=1930747 RepID=UPI0006A7BD3B|nr:hypothetical protein [Leucobacter musarum]
MSDATLKPIVTHACGHSQVRDLSDTAKSQRAEKRDWWATQKCRACSTEEWKRSRPMSAEFKAKLEARKQEAFDDAERQGLSPLQGTDKQVGFATEVRYKILTELYDELVQSGQMTEDEYEEKVVVLARRINRARFWLDHKESSTEVLLEDLEDPGAQNIGTENPF